MPQGGRPITLVLRVLNSHTFMTAREAFAGKPASIDFWDVASGKISDQIHPPAAVSPTDVTFSSDGQFIASVEDGLAAEPDGYAYKVFVWNMDTRKLIRTIQFPVGRYSVDGAAFAPGDMHRLVVTGSTFSVNSSAIRYGFQVIDALTGKGHQRFLYPEGVGLESEGVHLDSNETVFSPSGHRIARVDTDEGGGWGSIFDDQGRLLNKFASEEIGRDADSFTFITRAAFQSETKLFCDGFLYDLSAKRLRRALTGSNANLPCVAAVPSRPGYAFYLGKKGLELWNFTTQTRVRRWPKIMQVDGLYFSQDNRVLAVLDGQRLSLWPFNAKSLP